MADGTNQASPNVKTLSTEDAEQLYAHLLAMLSLAEIIQAAATGDMDMRDAGIYGTASLLEEQANAAIKVLGI